MGTLKTRASVIPNDKQFGERGSNTSLFRVRINELEDEGEGEHEFQIPEIPDPMPGKPQIWIRLRPAPKYDDNAFEICDDGKSLKLLVEPRDRVDRQNQQRLKTTNESDRKPKKGMTFITDGILQSSGQDETYKLTVNKIVENAMNFGIGATTICIGPEVSGKSFTLFGNMDKFEYRGLVPRALERIFQIVDEKYQEYNYIIRLGIIEVRKNRIRDLITLSPYDLQLVGENGPYGMFLQQIGCAEHGLGLLIRALAGQKNLPRESYARPHTIVFIEIHGETFLELAPRVVKCKLLFTKIASMPKRSDTSSSSRDAQGNPFEGFMQADGCVFARPGNPIKDGLTEGQNQGKKYSCCAAKPGTLSEAIAIRTDLSFLEQMFIRANEQKKMEKYYDKIEAVGFGSIMTRSKTSPSQHLRQNKLAHCLQDVLGGSMELRVILHIRPEKKYLDTTLAAFRFAERARCIPYGTTPKQTPPEVNVDALKQEILLLRDELLLQDRLFNRPPELSGMFAELTPEQIQFVQAQAQDYLDGNLETLEVISMAQIQAVLEYFRQLWRSVMEAEAVRRAEAEAAAAVAAAREAELLEQAAAAALPGSASSSQKRGSRKSQSRKSKHKIEKKSNASLLGQNSDIQEAALAVNKDIVSAPPPTPNIESETPDPRDSIKIEAWQSFLQTNEGQILFEALNQSDKALRETADEHNEVLKKVGSILFRMNKAQSEEMDEEEEEAMTTAGPHFPPTAKELANLHDVKQLQKHHSELLQCLKTLRMDVQTHKQIVEAGKSACAEAFQAFCSERFAGALTDTEVNEHEGSEEEGEVDEDLATTMEQTKEAAEKHFIELKRLARLQAKHFLKFYPKKREWTPYW